jgi:hypothetical protein
MIGSSRTGFALANAALNAKEAANLNANSDESTSWYEPKCKRTPRSTTG